MASIAEPEALDLDSLELELRKLPGVRGAGFADREDGLFVQVHAGGTGDPGSEDLAFQASRIAARHSELPVTLELVRWDLGNGAGPPESRVGPQGADTLERPAPPRRFPLARRGTVNVGGDDAGARSGREPRLMLLAVLVDPDRGEVEVHLTLDQRRAVGCGPADAGALGAVAATVDAVRGFCPSLPYEPEWARVMAAPAGDLLVVVALFAASTGTRRFGIASGDEPTDAAARATLHALNRLLALELPKP